MLSVHWLLVSTTFGCLFDYPPSSSLIGKEFLSGWMGVGGMYQDMPVFQDPFSNETNGSKSTEPWCVHGSFMDQKMQQLIVMCLCVEGVF